MEGPPIPITIDMVKKAISQMKAGKARGPSGIVVEMIRAAGDMGPSVISDLAAAIIRDGKVPSNWDRVSLSVSTRVRGDALERGNYRDLKSQVWCEICHACIKPVAWKVVDMAPVPAC